MSKYPENFKWLTEADLDLIEAFERNCTFELSKTNKADWVVCLSREEKIAAIKSSGGIGAWFNNGELSGLVVAEKSDSLASILCSRYEGDIPEELAVPGFVFRSALTTPKSKGQNIMSKLMECVLADTSDTLGLNGILITRPENIGARRVADDTQFSEAGEIRRKDGVPVLLYLRQARSQPKLAVA